jgi:hypothetical protein
VTDQGPRRPKNRCYLIYAVAPSDANVRTVNHLFNDFISDRRRGLCVFHDHFVARPGGVAVFDVRSDEEVEMLNDPGPLLEWDINVHTLAESLTAVGFVAQMDYTLEQYGNTTVERLRAEEEPKKRHWWNKPQQRDDASG